MPVSFPGPESLAMEGAILTGAGGFVGSSLVKLLAGARTLSLGADDWDARLAAAPLEGATIFHLAARVHDPVSRDEEAFRRDNVDKTRRLAEEAARRGARRLVFMSSVKVYGDESSHALGRDDSPAPCDPYGRSKLEAERTLSRVAEQSRLEVVVVRSPLVFGPRAIGNLASLMSLADGSWPLPFAAIDNRRSFVHVEDLARLLVTCGSHPSAVGRTYVSAHDERFSTPRLLSLVRAALGRPARLFGVAPRLLEAAAAIVGQGNRIRRLTRSLECDPSAAQVELGWRAHNGLESSAIELARAWRQGAA
jgi:UDP-glucose 4-epimerase